MREEFGEVAASRSGISKWASIKTNNSERDVQKVVEKQGTKLNVPITTVISQNVPIPWISPRAWVQFLLSKGLWYRLAGLTFEERHLAPQVWGKFWENFRALNPHFSLFNKSDIDLTKVAGFFIHGDEGRTLKRSALMVTTLQSALGFGFDSKRARPLAEALKLKVNYTGHTMSTRFVVNVLPKSYYDDSPGVFHGVMKQLAQSLRDLTDNGVLDPITGERYRIAIIGCKGDLPYLQKVGGLTRAWNTGVKRGQEASKPKGVCHLCMAGTDNHIPAEDIASHNPSWLRTMGILLPWESTPTFIKHLYHDVSDPAQFYMPDIWHCYHLGVGKSFVASVVQISLPFIPAPNLDGKWAWLTSHYRQFCKNRKHQPHVTKISAYLMSYGDKTGAMGAWSKGALTTNFMRWLPHLIDTLPEDQDGILKKLKDAASSMNMMFSCLFSSPAFIDRNECIYAASLGMTFLKVYNEMAWVCFGARKPYLFPMYPKLHYLHHAFLKMELDSRSVGFSENPLLTACQQDEDTIERTSRLSRRVSIRMPITRTLQRCLVLAHTVWVKAGMIHV